MNILGRIYRAARGLGRGLRANTLVTLLFVAASLLANSPGAAGQVGGAPPGAAPHAAPLRIFGATTQAFRPEDLAQAATYVTSRGVHDSRIIFSWEHIQTRSADKTYFDFSLFDSYMQAMPATTQLGIVGNNIDWSPKPCGCTDRNIDIDGMLDATRPPLAGGAGTLWSDWDIYVYRTVSRYGPHANGLGAGYGQNRVHQWEVMNEIDSLVYYPTYTDAQIVERGQKYGAILKRSIQIIKLADPAAVTITCGTSDYFPNESVPNETDLLPRTKLWIGGVASTGAYALVDGVSVHPYWALAFDGGNSMKQYLDNYSNLLVTATGHAIPLWVTELGYISSSLGLGCGPVCQTDFETESRVLVQNLTQIFGSNGTAAAYWFLSNTLTPQGGGWDPDVFALARECDTNTGEFIESARGQAFYAFKRDVVDPGYGFVSFQTAGDVSYYTFKNSGGYLHILWSKGNHYLHFAGLDAPTFSHMRVSDYRSNTIDTGFVPSSAYLTLTQDPVYLYSPTAISLASLAFDAGPALAQRSVGYASANCEKITGWACNAGDYTRAVMVGVYDGDIADGKPVAFANANQTTGNAAYDQTIAGACGGYGNRTFIIPTPLWLKGTGKHTLSAYALNLDGSPPTKLIAASGATTFQCINSVPTTRPGTPAAGGTPAPAPTTPRPTVPAASIPPLPIPPSR